MSDVKHSTALEHGLQTMLDLLTHYLGNNATRGEWIVEIQRRFTDRHGKLRRGWSDDSIDRKIHKLEKMGLLTGGEGFGAYYSVVATAQPRTEQVRPSTLLGFAGDTNDPGSALVRKVSATESFLAALEEAKQQLMRGKSSAA